MNVHCLLQAAAFTWETTSLVLHSLLFAFMLMWRGLQHFRKIFILIFYCTDSGESGQYQTRDVVCLPNIKVALCTFFFPSTILSLSKFRVHPSVDAGMMAVQWVVSVVNNCHEDQVPLHFSKKQKSPWGHWIALGSFKSTLNLVLQLHGRVFFSCGQVSVLF